MNKQLSSFGKAVVNNPGGARVRVQAGTFLLFLLILSTLFHLVIIVIE